MNIEDWKNVSLSEATMRPEDEDCDNVEESVWGFYGSKYCMEEARMVIDSMIEYEKKQEKLLNVCMSL